MKYIEQFSYRRIVAATQGRKRPNLTKASLRKYVRKHGIENIKVKDSVTGRESSLKHAKGPVTLEGPSPINPRWQATIRRAKVGKGHVVE